MQGGDVVLYEVPALSEGSTELGYAERSRSAEVPALSKVEVPLHSFKKTINLRSLSLKRLLMPNFALVFIDTNFCFDIT
jgi:hypothetical protein